ncbi:hypothetical protein MY4824_004644 [Beauveria thailandica]
MTVASLNRVPSTGDFESALNYVATVGYDVAFLQGDARRVLADNPVSEAKGGERFDPSVAPLGALRATGPWAARLLQGHGTFIDELAGTATWSESLDLQDSACRVAELVRHWMDQELPGEADMISRAPEKLFPKSAPASEQFYSLRDSIHLLQQFLPGSPSSRPALTLLLAFCIGVDEFLCPVQSLEATVYLGRRLGHLWDECVVECGGRDDAASWLALARDALHSSVFLQNREKLAYVGLVDKDKDVFNDWDTTAHYMLRAEAAMTPFVGFCLCAYAGLPFQESLAGAVGMYCYNSALVLDFCKRATRLGAGSFTEVALADKTGELQGRGHLIGSILDYGESVLPQLFLCVLRPYVMASSSVVDVLDRYRERSWGLRLPVGKATLCMMMAVMEGVRGSLNDDGTLSSSSSAAAAEAASSSSASSSESSSSSAASASASASSSSTPLEPSPSGISELAAEVVEMLGAQEAYDAYRAQPSVDALYRLPRIVRLVLQMGGQQASSQPVRQSTNTTKTTNTTNTTNTNTNTNTNTTANTNTNANNTNGAATSVSKNAPQPRRWMTSLATACAPPLPSSKDMPASAKQRSSRLGPVRLLGTVDKLQSLALRSPARPGGYAAGRREFTGRPVGSGSSV